jgi:chromosomal replication initiator protein
MQTENSDFEKGRKYYHNIWKVVKEDLYKTYGKDLYNSWFAKIEFLAYGTDDITLSAPTNFIRDWIQSNYLSTILDFCRQKDKLIKFVDIITSTSNHIENIIEETTSNYLHTEEDDIFSSRLDPRYNFQSFVVGKPNELAFAAASAVAESKKVIAESNPLFLYGGVGLGKTHLMHSTAWHIRKTSPYRKVIYISAEKFMYEFIKSLRAKDIMSFKDKFRSVDVLMIDDIQFISGKESTQEEFFHTFNELINNQRQVIISCDRSPSDLDDIEERIKSRLGWGLVADIHSTTYELRVGILQSKIEQLKIDFPQEVIEFLATKITSNVRELEGALNKVIAHSTLIGRKITIESTRDILKDLLRVRERTLSIDMIIKKVCEHFNTRSSDIFSSKRTSNIVLPRQVAMYLSKELTQKSYLDIARTFKRQDHTTVIHAVKKIKDLYNVDCEIKEDIEVLRKILEN